MPNDKPRDLIHLPAQDKKVTLAQQAQLKQSSAGAQSAPGGTPGRKPRFGR